ncbi:MAG: hypothetical protein AB8G77_26870 [Rhodothermales bacterium]
MSAYQYIVVVHGMGESRYGQTVLPVISRCAEVVDDVLGIERKEKPNRSYQKEGRDIVTLGAFVGANPLENSLRPWAEFDGIPVDNTETRPFTGIATHNPDGKLVRFVDIWWKDLVDESEHVLEPAAPWTDGLIGRIERMETDSPTWMPQLLFKLQDLLGPMQTLLKSRVPDIEDLAFNKYLGDVQIYAEYEPMRGIAVRRFHDRMAAVCKAHYDSIPGDDNTVKPAPNFTILAHSLGSIMSLDALMYAHKGQFAGTTNLPFPGYQLPVDSPPNTDWISHVKTFVTIGSPIDKFLLFWPYRYQYLNGTDWIDENLADRPRIKHINYCDEQDPVGQSLDTLRSTEAYRTLFTASFDENIKEYQNKAQITKRVVQRVSTKIKSMIERAGKDSAGDKNNEFDVVYRRSIWPGLAHTSYWKDKGLFKNILEHVLLEKAGWRSNPNVLSDKRATYIFITLLTYFIVPLLIVMLDTVTYDMFLEPESWKGYFTLGALFVISIWISREVINLLVWWRQLLRNKRSREIVPQTITSIFVKWGVRLGLPLLALGFAQVAINSSGTYVNQVQNKVTATPPSTIDGTAVATDWEALLGTRTLELVAPFQLISGTTKDTFAFWMALLSLLTLLTIYRTRFSNFKESTRYESYLSIPVDIIVLMFGYWLLLILWQEDAAKGEMSSTIWRSSLGLTALIFLGIWHTYTIVRNLTSKGKKRFLQTVPEMLVSTVVLIMGWFLITETATLVAEFVPDRLSPDARKRMTFFCFMGVIVWIYMALRFYVAKAQLGTDKVPVFGDYFK